MTKQGEETTKVRIDFEGSEDNPLVIWHKGEVVAAMLGELLMVRHEDLWVTLAPETWVEIGDHFLGTKKRLEALSKEFGEHVTWPKREQR